MRTDAELLSEALGDLHKGETIERALSRILRRHGLKYGEYLRIIGDVRDLAHRDKIPTQEAARRMASAGAAAMSRPTTSGKGT